MPDSSQDNSNYNEEMRQWMAKQTFWHRMKYGRHPGDRSKLFSFLAKAFIVLLVLASVAVFVYARLLSKQVTSSQFANHLKSEVAEQMGARHVEGSSLSWDSGVARMRDFSITGGRSNFFSTLEVERFSFPLEYSDVMKGEINIGALEVDGVDVKLRSGAFTDREWEGLLENEEVDQQKPGGGWLKPALDLDSIQSFDIRNFYARWGAQSWMAGSITECDLEISKKDGVWTVLVEEGKFSQNWIQNAEIQTMVLKIDSTAIVVEEAKLIMPSGSLMSINGKISLGGDPEFNLGIEMENFQLTDFIPGKRAMILAGELKADLQMTGSINRKEGLLTKGRLTAEPKSGEEDKGAIRDRTWLIKFGRNFDAELPVLRAFGDVLGADGIRYFTSERTMIDFEASRGNLKVTNMIFTDSGVGEIRGSFTYDGKSESITKGKLSITLEEEIFEGNRQLRQIRSTLFKTGAGGRSQFDVELMGSMNVLTEMDAQRVYKAAEEIED